jgi:hypothetical protein
MEVWSVLVWARQKRLGGQNHTQLLLQLNIQHADNISIRLLLDLSNVPSFSFLWFDICKIHHPTIKHEIFPAMYNYLRNSCWDLQLHSQLGKI